MRIPVVVQHVDRSVGAGQQSLDTRDVVALQSETGRHNTEALASKVKET